VTLGFQPGDVVKVHHPAWTPQLFAGRIIYRKFDQFLPLILGSDFPMRFTLPSPTWGEEIMEAIITEETDLGALATVMGPGSEEEQRLDKEIARLWEVHVEAKGVVKKTKEELKEIRERLSERLFQMKQLLARPGRNGQWSAWLKERRISRASADRLVQRFAATLPGYELPHESIPRTSNEAAEELARGLWPSFRKALTTNESVVQFFGWIAKISGVPHQWREEGLLVYHAVSTATDESPCSVPACGPASQAFDETPAATKEARDENAVAPTEIGLAVAAAETGNGVTA
jgi:hypothetical protein